MITLPIRTAETRTSEQVLEGQNKEDCDEEKPHNVTRGVGFGVQQRPAPPVHEKAVTAAPTHRLQLMQPASRSP